MNIDQYVNCRALVCYGKTPPLFIRGLIVAICATLFFLGTAPAHAQINLYTYVAAENATINFSTPVDVAYGANSSFSYQYAKSGSITFNNATFGDPIPGVVKSGYDRPFTQCAAENGSYAFTVPVEAAYGANGAYAYNRGVSGTVTFNNATFGDPISGVVKAGYYIPYTQGAAEGQSYSFSSPTDIAYGANGKYVFRSAVTGTITFNNATFGDPIPGVAKAGYFRPSGSSTTGGGGGGGGGSNSVYSVAASSVPAPTGSGVMSFRLLNGTNNAYSDSQIYWGVLGINPATNQWSYLDINGNLQPISTALNDASGHLVKNGVNYANIYSTLSQKQWVSMPRITSGRMFISMGGPCYIKTNDSGFAGPDINNPADPNGNVYFDFIEFTIDATGYHGNTTRVDMFGFPIQHRLVNNAGNYDQTVGELESETRAGIFSEYQSSVPSQFTSLATVQAPYRIVAPIHGSFAAGGANANYFAGYSSISTQDILLGVGGAADPNTCAAINRHVYTQPSSTWGNVASYYQAAPANYYSLFWHQHSINALAYGFCYDDVFQQAAYLEVGDPKGLIIRAAW